MSCVNYGYHYLKLLIIRIPIRSIIVVRSYQCYFHLVTIVEYDCFVAPVCCYFLRMLRTFSLVDLNLVVVVVVIGILLVMFYSLLITHFKVMMVRDVLIMIVLAVITTFAMTVTVSVIITAIVVII